MFGLIYLYIVFYYLNFICIFYFLSIYNLNKQFNQVNLFKLFSLVQTYTNHGWLFKLLFLCLSGLPPFFFFFIKFNFLIVGFVKTSLFIQFLIFLNIVISTVFYLKIFLIKNFKYTNADLKNLALQNKILNKQNKTQSVLKYTYMWRIGLFLFINFFSIVFFFDFYLIFSNYL